MTKFVSRLVLDMSRPPMVVHGRAVFPVLEKEEFEYSGPVAECRNEKSKQVTDQSLNTNKQLLATSSGQLAKTGEGINQFNERLKRFSDFGRRTYGDNGEYMRNANTMANTTASAGQTALQGDLAMNAMRTGANTSGFAETAAESRRAGQRDMTDFLAKSNADRLAKLSQVEQIGLEESKFPAQVNASLYAPSVSGSVGALSPAASAAARADNSFWDSMLLAGVGGAGQAFQGAGTRAVFGK
jgi:hypothetical protein